ncbi:hypothetical protein Tco_0707618 [Tanacetum coccineum]|uniref:Uncharacterized protein n=1 Tax=Tanacetum coccineum TaxID=301880 RepID=A0ABQ4YBK2_9ASTR
MTICLLMRLRFLGFLPFHVDKKEGDDSDDSDLDIYEPRVCYDENKGIYAEAVIFVNKRLVRLTDVTVEQWLYLIYGDHTKVDGNTKEGVISKWLVQSYKKQFDEYIEIKKQWVTHGIDADKKYDPSDVEFVECDEEFSDSDDKRLINKGEVAKIFRIETNIFDFETPICKAFDKFNYLLKIDTDLLTCDILGFKTYDEFKNK